MDYRDRTRSGDLAVDTSGHLLILLHMIAALCVVEAVIRTVEPIGTIFSGELGGWDGLVYAISFVTVFASLLGASQRWLGKRLNAVQLALARLVPAGPRTKDGYVWLTERYGLTIWDALWVRTPGAFAFPALIGVTVTILGLHYGGLDGGESRWFLVILMGFIGIYSALLAGIVVASAVVGRRLDRTPIDP